MKIRILSGFARGHYVMKFPRVKIKRVAVGPKLTGGRGWSLQLHTKAGVRYLDMLVFRNEKKRAGVEPTKPW